MLHYFDRLINLDIASYLPTDSSEDPKKLPQFFEDEALEGGCWRLLLLILDEIEDKLRNFRYRDIDAVWR